jgi:hypothetical protein
MLNTLKNEYRLMSSQPGCLLSILVIIVIGVIIEIPGAIDANRRAEILNGPEKYAIGVTTQYDGGSEEESIKYVFTVNGKPYYGSGFKRKDSWIDRFVRVPGGYYKVKYYPADPNENEIYFDSVIHIETKIQKN